MTKYLLLCPLLVLLAISGCAPTGDSLTLESISLMNEMSASLESGTSFPDVMKNYQARSQDLAKRMRELNLTQAEQNALQTRYEPQMKQAFERFGQAMRKSMGAGLPGMPGGMMPGVNPFLPK